MIKKRNRAKLEEHKRLMHITLNSSHLSGHLIKEDIKNRVKRVSSKKQNGEENIEGLLSDEQDKKDETFFSKMTSLFM